MGPKRPIEIKKTELGCHVPISHKWRNNNGYVMTKRTIGGKRFYLLHRYLWTLKHGKIPKDKCVLHKCDNRECINLDHLFLGTQLENIADCVRKKRNVRGEMNSTKLTEADVIEIKKSKLNSEQLANKFKVSRGHINGILCGSCWKHIGG